MIWPWHNGIRHCDKKKIDKWPNISCFIRHGKVKILWTFQHYYEFMKYNQTLETGKVRSILDYQVVVWVVLIVGSQMTVISKKRRFSLKITWFLCLLNVCLNIELESFIGSKENWLIRFNHKVNHFYSITIQTMRFHRLESNPQDGSISEFSPSRKFLCSQCDRHIKILNEIIWWILRS